MTDAQPRPPASAPATSPGFGTTPGTDWAGEAADAIERTVSQIRTKTVDRAQSVSTGVVFGVVAACFVAPASLMLLLLTFRLLVVFYEQVFGVDPFAAWLTLGGIFLALGAYCWHRRKG